METTRRFASVVLVGVLLPGLLSILILPVFGQIRIQPVQQPVPGFQPLPPNGIGGPGLPGQPNNPKPTVSGQFSLVQLNESSDFQRYIEVARDCIKDEAWNDAVTALQLILDNKEDFYVRVTDIDALGRKNERLTSVKKEANRLLGTMPQAGLNVYELRFGGRAKAMLKGAKKTGDIDLLGEVAQRFLHTQAGPEANDLLATYLLDRGQFFSAALRFDRLLSLPEKRFKVTDLALLKAALAYRRAGDMKKYDQAWLRLRQRLPGGMKIGAKFVPLDKLSKLLGDLPQPKSANPHDWALVRGNITNSAQSNGTPPLLDEVLWKRLMVLDKNDISGLPDTGAKAKYWIDLAVKTVREGRMLPVMPGAFPIAVDGKLIYRNAGRVMAISLHDIVEQGEKIPAGGLAWQSMQFSGSLAKILEKPATNTIIENWLNEFKGLGMVNFVYENSMAGTLSSDLQQVYAVDDLAVPIPPSQIQLLMPRFGGNSNISKNITDLIYNNVLHAYDIRTGKIVWRRGASPTKPDADFEESLFLGPPLPVGGKLYALNERKDGELRLVCLNPDTGEILPPTQTLGTVDQGARLIYDSNRRTHAVHLAYGEGILVCPTNSGLVLGVDLLSRTLAWAYEYREQRGGSRPGQVIPGQPISLTQATWKVAPPVVRNGKVIFTSPDAHSLHCLNLRDGTLAWKYAKQESDLFLAGVWHDKVLIIGKNSCKALRLADGVPAWPHELTTGDLPSGQGVASDNIYYLPLQNGQIVGIDIEKQRVIKNRPASDSAPKPGNLVFYEGAVLSQTPKEIIAYPQLRARLEVVRAKVKNNPNDLNELFYLGRLLLADGKVNEAVEKLRLVRAKNPPDALKSRTRQRLYEALTDLFEVDFKTASTKYMDEYKELLKAGTDTVEEQRRKGNFLRILGRGRESEGNLVAAYDAYRQFREIDLYLKNGVPAAHDPLQAIPMDVWLRGRLSTMMGVASDTQKAPLENKITEDWKQVRNTKDLTKIRGFVSMFDIPFRVGREARVHLASAIVEKKDRASFLEAELKLEQVMGSSLSDPAENARALEALARLEIEKGSPDSMRTAVSYYQRLADEFGDTVIRDGKTGKKLFDEITTDRRMLAYLGSGNSSNWSGGPIRSKELGGGIVNGDLFGFVLQPKGKLTAATSNIRLVFDINNTSPRIKVVDLAANKLKRTINLNYPPNNYRFFSYFRSNILRQAQNSSTYYPNAPFRFFHVKGSLAVVQVVSEIYAIDLESFRVLWHHNLINLDELTRRRLSLNGLTPDGEGRLQVILYNPTLPAVQRTQRRLIGEVGAAQASYVAIIKRNELIVVNPLNGEKMWSKNGVAPGTRIFGTDQYMFLVEATGNVAMRGQVLRASDGSPVNVKDFSPIFQNRLSIHGRRILAATPTANKLVLRLYDVPTGKDVWTKEFDSQAVVLRTEDPSVAGVIDPKGKLHVVNAKNGELLAQSNILQQRVTAADIQNLENPLLLADKEHYYVVLNKPVDTQEVNGGVLASNFSNGLRCATANGWVCAFHRNDGSRKVGGKDVSFKKGELHWYSSKPVSNQLIIVDQFRKLPVLLFSVRYNKKDRNQLGGINYRWISRTQSIDKRTGKWVHFPLKARNTNGASPRFNSFVVNGKEGTIEMLGLSDGLQHYIDDGRPRAKRQAKLQGSGRGFSSPAGTGFPPGGFPAGGFNPAGGFAGGFNPAGGFAGGIPGGVIQPGGRIVLPNGRVFGPIGNQPPFAVPPVAVPPRPPQKK